MKNIYGTFTSNQISETKKTLHTMVHWLLMYRDPENAGKFDDIDIDARFESLLLRISGLNDLLLNQPILVSIMAVLQSAKNENKSANYNWKTYRKLILDAHSLIDKIREEDDERIIQEAPTR